MVINILEIQKKIKMKKVFFRAVTVLLYTFLFSSSAFAQVVPGGSGGGGVIDPGTGGGGVVYDCPQSYSFKRNNGNGWGVCHGDAQIRIAFTQLPQVIPQLTGIYYEGNKITTIYYPVDGDVIDKTQPYISYCLSGGNIPPAHKLILEFTYPNGQICTTDNGN